MTTVGAWSPTVERVDVILDRGRRIALEPDPDRTGWWTAEVDVERHGARYAFSLDGSEPLPDPRSLWQPDGVHAPSRTYDHGRFEWGDECWRGPSGPTVVYELHVGTFTPGGTLDSAATRLEHLVELGITHVELMPLAAFDGPRGWGYDGVCLFAVHETYGGPDALKRFVDACHRQGLGVVLDVVYNHLGPSGNHLARFGPYFTDRYRTPWGDAINLDGPGSDEVRSFLLDNARSWIVDFHVDGLRLDAVHELHDGRALTLLEELASLGSRLEQELGRAILVTAESDRNDPRLVVASEAGGIGLGAAWNDDVHHALHALLSGERQGYYVDFGPASVLAKAWTDVYVHDGCRSSFRCRTHGRPVDPSIPADRFVVSLQNHDQVGNRALGDRLGRTVTTSRLEVGAALLLTSPFTPMLFMGEEWSASTPWPYFTSFPDAALGEAIRCGRRAEFAEHGWMADEVPDPQSEVTFRSAVLDWNEVGEGDHRRLLDWYRDLIALRRRFRTIVGRRLAADDVTVHDARRTVSLHLGSLEVHANLGDDLVDLARERPPLDVASTVLLSNHEAVVLDGRRLTLPPDSVAIIGPG